MHVHLVPSSRMVELYLQSPICLLGILLNYLRTGTDLIFFALSQQESFIFRKLQPWSVCGTLSFLLVKFTSRWIYRPISLNKEIDQSLRRSRDSVVGIATGYGLDDRDVGVWVPLWSRIFSSPRRPDRLWGSPNLLYNEYQGPSPPGI
jgi:hypothetical protein